MIWLALLVAVLVAVATAAAVLGRVDGSLADATTTTSHVPLPDDGLTPGDLDGLRFDTALRGYRMSQVDGVIDRLRREIHDLEDRLDHGAGRSGNLLAADPAPHAAAYARPVAGETAGETVEEAASTGPTQGTRPEEPDPAPAPTRPEGS